MDRKRLLYFVTLAEKLHFGAAAEKLNIAQSALSRQIGLLEEELSCMLFDRSNRWNVTLTAAGQTFLNEAKKILALVDSAKRLTTAAARGEAGVLHLELVPSAVNLPSFLDAIRHLQTLSPQLHFSIGTSNSTVICEKVRNGDADLGIVRMAPASTEELKMSMLANDRLLAAIPKKHHLARKEKLYLADLRQERFILQNSHDATPLRSMLDIICRNGGFAPQVVMEIENMTTVLHLLPVLDAITILPESFPLHYTDLVYRTLEDCRECLPISAVWRRDNSSPALKCFLNNLCKTPHT